MHVGNFVLGGWRYSNDRAQTLIDPVSGATIGFASSTGIDFGHVLAYARDTGGTALRQLGYADRAALLGQIADVLAANKADYYGLSLENSGATQADAAFDVDGAIFTLRYFARAGAVLGHARHLTEGSVVPLSKDGSFVTSHVGVPVRGAAVHINAFNFPSWGLWEKASVALLSGVAVVAKPATATCLLAERMVRDVVAADFLPPGALQLIAGSAGDLLDHLTHDDVVAFTGSAQTAAQIRQHRRVIDQSVRLNVEADSINSALLAPDAVPGTAEFDAFVREVVREMTVKAGQKCTAIRRAFVPLEMLPAASAALRVALTSVVVGNPRNPAVQMGPLVTEAQRHAALKGLEELVLESRVICGGGIPTSVIDADPVVGAFIAPTLLQCNDADQARKTHEIEIFGPVATLVGYRNWDHALKLAARGGGSLVASVYTADPALYETAILELATTHGRVLAVDASVQKTHTGHGNVMPACFHGGPGRAGGGEELGGLRGLWFYHRRSALQGPTARVAAAAQAGARVQL